MAAAVPGAVLQASDSIGDTVQLVIGPDYSTVVPVTVRRRPPREPQPRGRPTAAAAPATGDGRRQVLMAQPKRPEM